jgi:hypothetical protein
MVEEVPEQLHQLIVLLLDYRSLVLFSRQQAAQLVVLLRYCFNFLRNNDKYTLLHVFYLLTRLKDPVKLLIVLGQQVQVDLGA